MANEFKVLRVSGTGRIVEEDGRPYKQPVPASVLLNQLSRHAWDIVGLVPAAQGDHFVYLRRDDRPPEARAATDARPVAATPGDGRPLGSQTLVPGSSPPLSHAPAGPVVRPVEPAPTPRPPEARSAAHAFDPARPPVQTRSAIPSDPAWPPAPTPPATPSDPAWPPVRTPSATPSDLARTPAPTPPACPGDEAGRPVDAGPAGPRAADPIRGPGGSP